MKVELKKIELPSGVEKYETQHGRISNPPAEIVESENDVLEVGKRFKRRAIKLDEDEKMDLEKQLRRIIEDWEDSRSGLEQKLKNWNDLYEGVTPQTDFPWPGACSIHLPLPKIKGREIISTIQRSTMRPVPFLNTTYAGPQALYEESKEITSQLESFLEDKLKNDTNIHQTLKDSLPVIYRDGTCPIQIIWESNYETVTDWKLYDDPEEFVTDYRDADSAGIPGKEYRQILDLLGAGGKYEAEFEYEVATYDGPKAYIVSLLDFVHWPVYVPTIRDTACHGKRVWYTDYQLKDKVRCKKFREEDVEEILKFHGEEREESLTASRDSIEGISRNSGQEKTEEYQIFELVYSCSLTKDDRDRDVVRKYLIYYHYLSQKILRIEPYPVRKGKPSYFALRYIRRDNRLLGISLLDDISDLSVEADTLIRQMTNSRTITHVPSFKAKFSAKSVFDPSRKEFRFRPGVTFYMGDVQDVMQFDIRPVDLSGSSDQLMLMMQLIDMTTGSSSGLSGQANPIDPRAPARKQQELLRQSSNRIDDYVNNLLPDFEEIGQYVIDLYYQNAPDRINYYMRQEDGSIIKSEIDRSKLFNPNVKFKVNGTSVFMNPEAEFARMQEIENIIATNPTTANNPRIRRNSLERLLMSSRVDDEKSFLPSQKELPQAFESNEEADRAADDARNKEKLANRIADAQAKREHELVVAKQQADLEARNLAIEAALAAVSAPPGEAPPGAGGPPPPAPAGVNGAQGVL